MDARKYLDNEVSRVRKFLLKWNCDKYQLLGTQKISLLKIPKGMLQKGKGKEMGSITSSLLCGFERDKGTFRKHLCMAHLAHQGTRCISCSPNGTFHFPV